MILAIDIGNTTVALGGIRDGRVCFVAHMDTVRTRTAAEYRAEMEKVFSHRRHPEKPIRFEGAVLTSVVPQITGALAECARHYTGKKPVILSTGLRALGERCAQLPQVHLSSPKSAIGVDTEKCMLSGSVLGTAVLLDGITQRIEEELGRPATLVVTGGLAKYVIPLCRHPLTYDPELLLKGLALLYQLNAPQHERHHEPRSDGERRRPRPAGRRPYNNGSSPRRRSHNNRRPHRDDEAKAG